VAIEKKNWLATLQINPQEKKRIFWFPLDIPEEPGSPWFSQDLPG
jgi:hypothetical protein